MAQTDAGHKPRRQWAPDARALRIVGDRWLMVIVRDLASGPLRLETLRRWLPGVSAGALQARLADMEREGLIARQRYRSLPPRVNLELTERGHELAAVIAELARWELRTQWSSPRDDEWVDIAACFRLAPFLDPPSAKPDGELALTVVNNHDPQHYTFVREQGRARIEHRQAPAAQAHLSGTQHAWVKALSPGNDHSKLKTAGKATLARSFLRLFSATSRR